MKNLTLHDDTDNLYSATVGLQGDKLFIDVYYGYDSYGILLSPVQIKLLKDYLNEISIKTNTLGE